jgi:hypothetical protein
VTAPPLNQVDAVLVSLGITASTCVILRMGIPRSPRSFYMKDTDILMPFAQDYSDVMTTALHTCSLQPSPFRPHDTTLQL